MKSLTIFTPTYNRGYCLEALYDSLKKQSSKDFCWLIVNDGSEDNTEEIVKRWISEGEIDIQYRYQENSGKAQAHNLGVKMTKTPWFTCVDSDDALAVNAVERVIRHVKSLDENIIGMVAKRIGYDGEEITYMSENIQVGTLYEAYDKKLLKGDTFLIYRTKCIGKVSFPRFEGEKFFPESYLYDQLDEMGKMYFLNEGLYLSKYLDDGYTKSMDRQIAGSPHNYMAYVKNRLRKKQSLKRTCSDLVRYVSAAFVLKEDYIYKQKPILSILMLPLGYVLYNKRFKRYCEEK